MDPTTQVRKRTQVNKTQLNRTLSIAKSFIEGNQDWTFDEVAVALYELHREYNPAYARYATVEPKDIKTWRDIPLMPIGEFKSTRVGLELGSQMPNPGVIFKSSGTTSDSRSIHHMLDTEHYRAAIARGVAENWLGGKSPGPLYRVIALTPPLQNSSLFYMMQYLGEILDYCGSIEVFSNTTDREGIAEFLENLKQEQEYPVFLFGTSLAFYDFYQNSPEELPSLELPEGSLLIETGGWKGRDIQMTHLELTESIAAVFGLEKHQTLREYSMSEMSSQLYQKSQVETCYYAPEYLGVRTLDPLSQKDVDEGIIGFVDLANVWSCPFVLTEDMGVLYNDGGLQLLGRVVSAPEKGCSLSYAEAMGRQSGS